MSTRFSLSLVAASTGAAALVLARLALTQHHALSGLPLAAWGPSQLSAATLGPLCLLAALTAAWHSLSALLALAASLSPALDTSRQGASPALLGLSRRAGRLVRRWGAPAVRRLAAGALVASLGTAPALAAEDVPADYLGWQPAQSAPATPGAPPAQPQEAAPGPGSEAFPGATAAQDAQPSRTGPPVEPSPSPAGPAGPSRVEGTEPPVSAPAPATSSRPAPGAPNSPEGQRTHVVQPGDSLWSLSAEMLGPHAGAVQVAETWPLLYEANREAIGADPALIRPGTTLVLPGPGTHS